MAIYYLSTKPISRGQGRSATAAAAYRSGELVHDLTTDELFDYTRKRGVEHTEIVLPTAAARMDINWARDRESLWNAAEVSEKRKDARVAWEYEVALPHELTASQRVSLVRAFSSDLANRYGVAVDFSIHAPHREGDDRNHHAHILTTTRQVRATGLGEKASIEWSDTDRAKKGLTPAKVELKAIRERWAVLTNEHLKERGIEVRVDHRTLEAQGIDRAPTVHLGPAVSAMGRRGIQTEVGQRISLERASERLTQAAELGRLERERQGVERSILDLSGDLAAARAQRDRESSAAEPLAKPVDQAAEAREQWLRERKAQGDQGQTLEEIRKQGREDWLKYREQVAQGDAPARERTLIAMEFQRLARRRADNQETAADWAATPKKLRDAIYKFNREPAEVRRGILKAIVLRPTTAKALGEQIKLRQEQRRNRDHGQGLER